MRPFHRRLAEAAFMIGAGALAAPAHAIESTWSYNGSSVLMVESGANVTITYQEPRPALRKEGVRRGTVLLRGKVAGSRLAGTSYVFRDGCDPAGYEVAGDYAPGGSQQTLELAGVVPQREATGCAIVVPAAGARPSRLLFTRAVGSGSQAGAADGGARGIGEDKSLVVREQACSGYTNPAENEVCLDRNLWRLDATLNDLFQKVSKTLDAKGRTSLKAAQLAWLKERDACGANGKCLEAAYKARIGVLEKQVK